MFRLTGETRKDLVSTPEFIGCSRNCVTWALMALSWLTPMSMAGLVHPLQRDGGILLHAILPGHALG